MSHRFAIGILAVAAFAYFVASAQAQQETAGGGSYYCIVGTTGDPVVGWTWTSTFTLDKEFVHLGDSVKGTLNSGANLSACDRTGNSIHITAFTRSGDSAPGGATAAQVISFFRTDVVSRVREPNDWRNDEKANKCGQRGGNCDQICAPFIPISSPGKAPFPGWPN